MLLHPTPSAPANAFVGIGSVLEHGRDERAASAVLGKARWISSRPGVAGVDGLRGPEDFLPLAAGAVSESDRLRDGIT